MKNVIVNRSAGIVNGTLKGLTGLVVGFDCVLDEVEINLDEFGSVITSSDNIIQDINSVVRTCQCGCQYTVKETENDGRNLCHHCGKWF